jgi:hypothetical protein
MWVIDVVCSDPECAEEREIVVAEIDEVDLAACECGGCFVTLTVARFEPVAIAA